MIAATARPPHVISGIRIGAPTNTTRGLKQKDMEIVAAFIDRAIRSKTDGGGPANIKREVAEMCGRFSMPHGFSLA